MRGNNLCKKSSCFWLFCCCWHIYSLQFSCSVVSDSLQPHESQHARPPCPSPTPGVHPESRPSSQGQRSLLNVMRQSGGEGSLGENGYMCICGWVPSLFTWNYHHIVNQLYPNRKLKVFIKTKTIPFHSARGYALSCNAELHLACRWQQESSVVPQFLFLLAV